MGFNVRINWRERRSEGRMRGMERRKESAEKDTKGSVKRGEAKRAGEGRGG